MTKWPVIIGIIFILAGVARPWLSKLYRSSSRRYLYRAKRIQLLLTD